MKCLDQINKKILNTLQENSSITNAELSNKIGLAPATTLERVKKLEKNNIIKKYVALVDGDKIGKGTVVFVAISMLEHSVESINVFNRKIQELPEVIECYRIAGEKDYLLKVIVEDIKSYESFAIEKLAAVPGIARISTTFSLSTVKYQTKITIDGEDI
jgi:Lrp/AsnC family leucine-responsive transcriptional regulator